MKILSKIKRVLLLFLFLMSLFTTYVNVTVNAAELLETHLGAAESVERIGADWAKDGSNYKLKNCADYNSSYIRANKCIYDARTNQYYDLLIYGKKVRFFLDLRYLALL